MNINRRGDVYIASSLFLRCPALRAVARTYEQAREYRWSAEGISWYNFINVRRISYNIRHQNYNVIHNSIISVEHYSCLCNKICLYAIRL